MKPEKSVHVFINGDKYEFDDPVQTGAALKTRASVPLADVLFLQQPGEDDVVPNDGTVTLKNGAHFHSSPPADYGGGPPSFDLCGGRALPQPDGWTFVVFGNWRVPEAYRPHDGVRLMVKLPPLFPDAQPDMFWVQPPLATAAGAVPRGASNETVLGEVWQRFSWHLASGAWKPGISSLPDYLRCIRARLERRD
ncbi:MAG: multiubiquitin domain-containing protein [Myxococcota bacterium]